MNAVDQARTAYASPEAPVRTPRGTEAEAMLRVTRALNDAATRGRGGFPALARAIHENRRLWSVLAASVADGANALPETLRAQIFWLAQFTDQHSREVLAGREDVSPLVDINSAVLRGLRAGGEV